MELRAICVSKDQKWIVCGAEKGVSVWDGEMNEKVIDVQGTNGVWAVDVSPDSTRFATGTRAKEASVWSLTSGERLVGPLQHDDYVNGVRFSPTGEHIATACRGDSISIFDSQTGSQLVCIKTDIPIWLGTPLAWSNDAQQIFTASRENKIRSFDVATGSQLAESQILDGEGFHSIALATNGKFIAAFTRQSISFMDTSTLARIYLVTEHSNQTRSISISPDNSYFAAGQYDGKILVRDLSKILPNSYGPFQASISALIVLGCQKGPIHHLH